MKNLILITAIAFASICHASANNEPESSAFVVLENQKAVVVNLNGAEAEVFSIMNEIGEVVFTKFVGSSDDKVKFNLEQLPAGEYTFKLKGDDRIEFLEANLTNDIVEPVSNKSYSRPVVRIANEKVTVDALFSNEENVKVNIFNQFGELVYEASDRNSGDYEKTFNLEQLQAGNYEVVVMTQHFSQTNHVSLK